MNKVSSRIVSSMNAKDKRYKSPFKKNRTSLFNVEAATDKTIPHEYAGEAFTSHSQKSDKVVG